jgi:hypothetical protein
VAAAVIPPCETVLFDYSIVDGTLNINTMHERYVTGFTNLPALDLVSI